MKPSDSESPTQPKASPSAQRHENGKHKQAGTGFWAFFRTQSSLATPLRIVRHQEAAGISILAALTVLICGPHVLNGGLIADDWAIRAQAHFAGFSGILHQLVEQDVRRPGGAFYLATVYTLIGNHVRLLLSLSAAMRFLLSATLFMLLRKLRFDWPAAVSIAALTLLFPASDSTWLWAVTSQLSFAVVCVLLGILLNLRALDEKGSHFLLLRIVGLALIITGLLTYELVVPISLASGALYFTQTPPRRALHQWGIDVLVLGTVIIVFTFRAIPLLHGSDNHEIAGFAQMREHAHAILSQSATLLTHSLLPYGTPRNVTVLGLFGAVVALTLVVISILRHHNETRRALLRWLVVASIGVLVVGFGYIFLVPANIYYVPLQLGIGNRVNDVSAIGYALVVYAFAALVGTLVFRELPHSRVLIGTLTILITMAIGVGYVRRVHTDEAAWHQAIVFQREILHNLRHDISPPMRETSIVTLGVPIEAAPGVPVFSASWDLNAAVQLLWNDPTLKAYPMAPGMHITCSTRQLLIKTSGSPPSWQGTYPTDIINVPTESLLVVKSQPTCIAAATKLEVLESESTTGS
jgi:hypothetical protein